jgi:hypothetical protein
MQWPLTSQLHGSVSQREQLVFFVTDQTPRPYDNNIFLFYFSDCTHIRHASKLGNVGNKKEKLYFLKGCYQLLKPK